MNHLTRSERRRQRRLLRLKKVGVVSVIFLCVTIFSFIFVRLGGKLVVDEERLILDATTTVETADGTVVSTLYEENRVPVSIDHIPKHVQDAFVAIEDRRFYEHAGVDFQSIIRAIYRDIVARSKVEGASTITQQLSKNLFLTNEKTWMRKIKEVMAARYLERNFSKKDILEMYLNQMYFGQGVYGVEMASQTFFSKTVRDLTIAEGALLAGLAKAPNGYSPIDYPEKALKRRNIVLLAMDQTGKISTETRLEEQRKTLGLNLQQSENHWDPAFASYIDLVMKEAAEHHHLSVQDLKRGGYRIVINMDPDVQQLAYEQFQEENYFPGNTDGVEGALLVKNHQTGEIIAAIGGRHYQLGDLNRVTVNRQPGSVFKPISVYGPALMTESYEPYSLLPDRLVEHTHYSVQNPDHQYDETISLYEAIMQSKNTSAVWLLDQIGIDYAKEYLTQMGLTIPDDGLAIGLGGLKEGVNPLQMADAYSSFANHGTMIESFTISKVYNRENDLLFQAEPEETKIFTKQVAWDMTEMLLRTTKEGTAKSGEYGKDLAGKTGTTEHPFSEGNNKDAWFVGYTPEYVIAVWMGYDHSDEDHYLIGGSDYPTQLTKDLLTKINQRTPLGDSFTKPEGVRDLPAPIELPEISDVNAELTFDSWSLVKGKITWTGSPDERVIYRIYKTDGGLGERIGEVSGTTEFIIDNVSGWPMDEYYIIPYDPLTKLEGKRSKRVQFVM